MNDGMLIVNLSHSGEYDALGDWRPTTTFTKKYTTHQWVRFLGVLAASGFVEKVSSWGGAVVVEFWPEWLNERIHEAQRARIVRGANTYAMQDAADADMVLEMMNKIISHLPTSPVAEYLVR